MIPEGFLMQAAKPLIDNLINKLVVPKIERFVESCNLKYNELLIPKGEHFEEYLYRTYKKYSIINTLVFKNERRLLKELYVPLTLKRDKCQSGNETLLKIDKYPSELIKDCDKVLITDTAGMGKSTLTKNLFLDVIENGYGIPIYIEMRRLSRNRTILHEIQEQINSLSKNFDLNLLLEFIQTGGFVFFLDGYDEISLEERNIVTTNIQDFISKANKNVFFLTSRPEQALASFGDFQVFSINSLSKKEAYELLRKYDRQGSTSKRLIEELRTGQYEMINEFLKNPLLVSLLFAAFDYKHTIPLKKHIFYRQVYDAYFDSHDLSKGDSYIHEKCSNLDIDDFDRVLRFIGFKSLQYQKIEFEKDVLLQIITDAKEFCSDLNFSTSNFLTDILTAVPLFCQDGQYYKWVHKSLQEYFAAQFIYKDSKQEQDTILSALYQSVNADKYFNLLDLYYDIDNWGFRKNILLPLCEDYLKFFELNDFSSTILDRNHIEDRIGFLFMRQACIMKFKIENEDELFEKLNKRAESCLNIRISQMVCFHGENICISSSDAPQRKLISLLKKRIPNLFRAYQPYSQIKLPTFLPLNQAFFINADMEKDNKDRYLYINFYLREDEYILCKNECGKEIENIRRIIKNKKEASSLTIGL